jgi:phytoene dehydrogenase-like protein
MNEDGVVVGAGPNGLAAAIMLAQAGWKVLLIEGYATPGGGCRTEALTLPGFAHDVCSAVHPLALSSPFLRTLPLAEMGLRWVHSPASLAHPFDDGTAITLERSITATAEQLGPDAEAYRRLMAPLASRWDDLSTEILAPLLKIPAHPVLLARFGTMALLPAQTLAHVCFSGERARTLFAGLAAHSTLPLSFAGSAAFVLVLGASAHAVGWPLAQGGSQAITDALTAYFGRLGGEVRTGWHVKHLDELPRTRATLLDVTPRQLLQMGNGRLPSGYARRLARYQYGMGVCKVDWALSAPIPWKAPACARSATVHLGGSSDEIAASERAAWEGKDMERPFVLLVQPSLFDSSRAPAGSHTAWAYCHVPLGSPRDYHTQIEDQIERFAPGFKACILARHVRSAVQMAEYNPNDVGGDISGGAPTLWQLFARPTLSAAPYATPVQGLYLCSSSTPPGGGVHGMCGYHAAKAALRLANRHHLA